MHGDYRDTTRYCVYTTNAGAKHRAFSLLHYQDHVGYKKPTLTSTIFTVQRHTHPRFTDGTAFEVPAVDPTPTLQYLSQLCALGELVFLVPGAEDVGQPSPHDGVDRAGRADAHLSPVQQRRVQKPQQEPCEDKDILIAAARRCGLQHTLMILQKTETKRRDVICTSDRSTYDRYTSTCGTPDPSLLRDKCTTVSYHTHAVRLTHPRRQGWVRHPTCLLVAHGHRLQSGRNDTNVEPSWRPDALAPSFSRQRQTFPLSIFAWNTTPFFQSKGFPTTTIEFLATLLGRYFQRDEEPPPARSCRSEHRLTPPTKKVNLATKLQDQHHH